MKSISDIWKDSVWSKVIASGITFFIGKACYKYFSLSPTVKILSICLIVFFFIGFGKIEIR